MGSGLLALVISVIVWPVVGFVITVAHEGGHAITGSLMGGRVDAIEIHADQSGGTYVSGLGRPGNIFTGLAGYVGPSIFGLAGALLLTRQQTTAVLWLSVVLLAVALFQSSNMIGRVVTVCTGAAIVLVIRFLSRGQQTFFAYTWIWLLLFGGFGHVVELQQIRRRGTDKASDAYKLRAITFLPASLWSGIFWLFSLAALILGGGILLGAVRVGR